MRRDSRLPQSSGLLSRGFAFLLFSDGRSEEEKGGWRGGEMPGSGGGWVPGSPRGGHGGAVPLRGREPAAAGAGGEAPGVPFLGAWRISAVAGEFYREIIIII